MKTIASLSLFACLGHPVDEASRPVSVANPRPCTTFTFKVGDQILFGRNYDWYTGSGVVTVNKRGLAKTALLLRSEDVPARWESRFGSVTFNQYGREFAAGGINEAGLVVECMWLAGTRYPVSDRRPALQEITWIQYQLDTARTVDDVVASGGKVRILQTSLAPLHFLVCDRTGTTATIEFLDGAMVVHRGDALPFSALANSRYSKSVSYLGLHQGFGGAEPIDATRGSLDRFCRAVAGMRSYSGEAGAAAVRHAFSVLEDVSQADLTQWSIVYDVANLRVHWRTKASPAVKFLDLSSCDFSTRTPCAVLDIQTAEQGDTRARFAEYTTAANRRQVRAAFEKTAWPPVLRPLGDAQDEFVELLARYPATIDVAAAAAHAGDKTAR